MGFMASRTEKQYKQNRKEFCVQFSFTQNSLIYLSRCIACYNISPFIFSEKKSEKE